MTAKHEPIPSTRCTASVKPTPPDKRPPGPASPPRWCCLQAGHEGPHRYNGGGMHASVPFRASDEVEHREPITVCAKCGTRWPCQEGNAEIGAFVRWIEAGNGNNLQQTFAHALIANAPEWARLQREHSETPA